MHGPRDRPRVALTFHGQGEPAVVGALLDELAAARVRVTVLAVGTWLAAQPGLARRVLDAGHELGNHTQHHADIKRMPAAAAHAEIAECAQALKALTGSIGRWFRPSQTPHATPTIKAAAAAVGLSHLPVLRCGLAGLHRPRARARWSARRCRLYAPARS